MDRPEIIANKGYETFAEHFVNEGIEKGFEKGKLEGADQERKKNEARDKKIAEFLRSNGVSSELLTEALAIKW